MKFKARMIEKLYMFTCNKWESSLLSRGVVLVEVSQSLGIWPKYSL